MNKRCNKCRSLLPIEEFAVDRSRVDGRKYICRDCTSSRVSGPPLVERERMAAVGLAWCSGCERWLVIRAVRSGKCRKCWSAYERQRFATDPVYRAERKRHAKLRKRGVEPVPHDAASLLLDDFGGCCAYCCGPANAWDHITPVSQGGKTEPGNIVPSCVSCNSSKGATPVDDFVIGRAKHVHPQLYEVLTLQACL